MKRFFAVASVILCIACNRAPEPKAEAAAKPEPARATQEVVLPAEAQKRAAIEVLRIQPESVSETIEATGQLTVNEDQTWSVGALLNGRIVTVAVKPGDTVRTGQVLARMYSETVHDSRATYKRAVLELTRVQGLEAQALRMRDRARRLLELKAMSQQEAELAETEYRNAQVAVQHARYEVEKEKTHLTEYLDVPLETASDDLVPIKSPGAGVVIERKATPGTVVSIGQEVFRITTPSSVWMIANVNEAHLSHLRPGQRVRVKVRAYTDRSFAGTILRLGEQLDETTRTLQVRVLLPNAGGLLKPEMYAAAQIDRGAGREAIFIPESATQDLDGNRVVFVKAANDKFQPRLVQTGQTIAGRTEVLEGLKPGDEIVTKGAFILKSQMMRGTGGGE